MTPNIYIRPKLDFNMNLIALSLKIIDFGSFTAVLQSQSMSEARDEIKKAIMESRLFKDFSELTNGILKKRHASPEAVERANEIIRLELEELTEQISQLIKT